MTLRDRLLNAVKESVESTYDMINSNTVDPNQMGISTSAPGEFAPEEITDKQNLVNQGSMSNDNDYNKDECGCEVVAATVEITGNEEDQENNLLKISEPEEIVGPKEEDDVLEMHKRVHGIHFGESRFAKIVERALSESEYGAPLSYVPDTRINSSDVLREIKAKLKDDEDKAKVSINKNVDTEDNKTTIYTINQVEHDKLPKEITVENVVLKLDDKLNNYVVKDTKENYPVKQDN